MANQSSVNKQNEVFDGLIIEKRPRKEDKRLVVSDYNHRIFELIVENVEDYAIFTVELDGEITSWNPGVEKLLGYSEAEFVGRPAELIFTLEDRAAQASERELKIALQAGRCEDVRWHLRRDNSRIWANGLMMRLTDDAGEVRGFVKIMRDDTGSKEAEEMRERLFQSERAACAEAEAARRKAENATRAKDELLALVSHELRNPLNSILGWCGILRQDPTPEMVKKVIDIIERQSRQQSLIIEDLLDAAQIAGGKLDLEAKFVDLVKVLTAAIDNARPAAEGKNVILSIVFDTQASQVTGDEQRLLQVVSNLLTNAIKFTPAGGRIEVELRPADECALIVVKDTGAGIAPEVLPHIFERYKQGSSLVRQRGGGLGLGLSLVQHIVERHNGTVRAESAGEGMGATFTVQLPFDRADQIKQAGEELEQQMM